jgi:cell wall-associated NlpC family hydrolase
MRCPRLLRVVIVAFPLATGAPWVAAQTRVSAPSIVSQAKTTVVAAADKVWHGTQDVAIYALGLIGVAYRFGGETPDGGVDCSGLVRHVFQQVTGVTLPRTAKELSRLGDQVAKKDLAPGDLVFFDTRRFAFSHVGIYLGDNRFIHAPRRGRDVEIAEFDNRYWQKHFNGARRLVGVLPSLVPALVATAEAAPVDLPTTLDDPLPDIEPKGN